MDAGTQKKLNEIKTSVFKSQGELEMNMTRQNGEISGRLTRLDAKVDKVQTWEYVEMKIKEGLDELKKELNDKIVRNDKKVTSKLDIIFNQHLQSDGVIGSEEAGCEYPTLMEYTLKFIPELLKKVKKTDEQVNQAQFGIKNNAAKLKKAIENDIPGEFRSLNRLVEMNDKNFKKFE